MATWYGMAGARDNSSTFIEEFGSVATTSWTASKSGKVVQTYIDGDHFAITQSHSDTGALEQMMINL